MNVPDIALDPIRLAVLEGYRILDTPAETGFDDVVQLAGHICDTPVALVSLVAGDRQWFKARVGFTPCETDLNSSVCAHALSGTDLLIIPDLTADPRTQSNPLVTGEPHIRFYAGAPLITEDGVTLGTLCVIDSVPRPEGLSEKQATMLRLLAGQVMSQLELRRAVAERDAVMAEKLSAEALGRVSSLLYTSLFDAIESGFCIIELKFEDGKAVDYRFDEVNRTFEVLTGLTEARGKWMSDLRPAHEQHWFDRYGKVALTGESTRFELPAQVLGDRWFEVHAFPIQSGDHRIVGVLYNDISDRKDAELARREAEAVQNLVNEELSHRMKNMFAMVQAVATQTMRAIPDREAVEGFTSRIQALSKAHDVLLHQQWTASPMGTVIRSVLGPLPHFEQFEQFELSGPDIDLGAKATLTVALLLHELTTNAIKYGALSTDAGRVRITWDIEDDGEMPELVVRWAESGGPEVGEPNAKGFGSKLIRTGLIGGGGTNLDYHPSGLRAEFRAPLDQVQMS